MELSRVVSIAAVLLTVVFAWPQVVRAVQHGVAGIAPGAIVQSLVSASMWFGYGMARRLGEVMLADLGVIVGQTVVITLLVKARAMQPSHAAAVMAGVAAAIALAQVEPLTLPVVLMGGMMGLTSAFTQLVEVIREPHKLEGLSGGSYFLLTALALAWLGYGIDHGDWAIIGPNIVMVPIAGYVTFAAWRSHTERAATRSVQELAPQPEW